MAASLFSFGTEQFNRLFPFYILIDDACRITSLGKSVVKICPARVGQRFGDCFQLKYPNVPANDFSGLQTITNQLVLLSLPGDGTNLLRGQFEYMEDKGQILFIGTPKLSSLEEIKEDNLDVSDFALHDAQIEQLNALQEQEIAIKDIKGLLKSAKQQNSALKYGDELWNFALNGNSDGIWQYDFRNEDGISFTHDKIKLGENGNQDEFSYKRWLGAIHPDDTDRVNSAFAAYVKNEAPRFVVEHRLKDKDGNYKYFITRGIIVERDAENKPKLLIGTVTDIDEQKKLEFQLKETANRLFFLIKNLDSGVVLEGKDQRITLVNEQFCKFLKLKETPEQLVGVNFAVAIKLARNLYKDPEGVISRINQILEQKQIALNELIELADGRFFKRDYVPIYLDGKFEGQLWQFVDVTEQIVTKRQLEEQKIFYENVLNNVPADIVAFSPNHEYLFINPMSIKNPQLREWMIGKRDEDFCIYRNKPMSIAKERRALFNKVLASKKLHSWEEKTLTPGGTVEYHLRNMYPVLNDKDEVTQVIGFGLDITDVKRIEEQLKINEKRFRDLFNYSQAFICTHDLDGKIMTINPAMCELLGYVETDLTGKMLTEFIPKDDIKKFYTDYLEKVISNGNATGVLKVVRKNNKESFLLYKNFKVEEENSEPYIIGFSQDITERVNAEKELLTAKKATEDSHRAKEIFLANMSHEIRTPMTGILGIANLLSKTELDEQQKKFTKLISESANNLLTIVNDVLDIEKIAAGKIDLEYIPFKIEDKVFTTLQSFQFKAEDKNINLLLNSTLPDDLVVIGDPYRLSQIINNLLSNALKFTYEGEISINMDYRPGNDSKSMIMEIQVQDTGIGIKEDRLSDIFNPYVQATSDTTRKYGGTGLGLTICKNLIEMQGGKITVASKVNEGTTFTFQLPYQRGDVSLLPADSKEDLNFKDLESVKILVAEDVELNQFLIKHILESWGCEVTVVSNGNEAVEKVRKQQFDLILMDIQMPEMDGISATKMIRSLNIVEKSVIDKSAITKKIRTLNAKDKSAIPIIALTANALKGDGQKYLNIGMNGYISKPYTEEKLFQVINDAVKTNDKLRNRILPKPRLPIERVAIPSEKLYDLSMVDSIGKDDPEFVKNILTIFIDTMPANADSLAKAGNEHNYESISKIAHKMKSSIDLLGVNSLKYTIRKLENVVVGDNEYMPLIENVKSTIGEVVIQLKELIEVN